MTTPMTWMWSPTYSRCDESAIFLQESKDDAGTECGSLGGGRPASQTLQETARDVGQDERGRMHGEGAREGGRVPLSYGCSAPRREARMKIPESTKLSLQGKLVARQRERWPQLQDVRVRFRGNLAYVDGVLSDGDLLPLCRLRYAGSATYFGFAVYLASRDGYEDSFLPNGAFEATPADALDCACGLYLGDPTAWVTN